jgi:glycosyltransferase involved in cell wall biosynthesis
MTASRSPAKESGTTILFAGNFIHPPNVDAAIWLAEEIFPQVRTRHPDATLQLVGAGPPASVRKVAGPGVVVTGSVPDVAPFLEAATVVVAPLRIGGGIRLKVMDALVFGKPTVATRRAAEGLNVTDRRELLLADESVAFAEAVSSLLADRPLRESLSANAQAWGAQFGTPGRVGVAFDRLYESLAGRNSNTSNDQ